VFSQTPLGRHLSLVHKSPSSQSGTGHGIAVGAALVGISEVAIVGAGGVVVEGGISVGAGCSVGTIIAS
jgi:hypothetical protein